jgi:hypothetical protein
MLVDVAPVGYGGSVTETSADWVRWPRPPRGRQDTEILESIEALAQQQLVLLEQIAASTALTAKNTTPPPPAFARSARLTVKGDSKMGLNVDSTGQNAVLTFEDDKGDVVAPPPGDGSGLVVDITSTGVITLGAAELVTDPAGVVPAYYAAPISITGAGEFTLSATVANTSGAALTDADGTTPFVQPAPLTDTVAVGQATGATLSD